MPQSQLPWEECQWREETFAGMTTPVRWTMYCHGVYAEIIHPIGKGNTGYNWSIQDRPTTYRDLERIYWSGREMTLEEAKAKVERQMDIVGWKTYPSTPSPPYPYRRPDVRVRGHQRQVK